MIRGSFSVKVSSMKFKLHTTFLVKEKQNLFNQTKEMIKLIWQNILFFVLIFVVKVMADAHNNSPKKSEPTSTAKLIPYKSSRTLDSSKESYLSF